MMEGSSAAGPCLENNEIELGESLWRGPRRETEGVMGDGQNKRNVVVMHVSMLLPE